MATACLPSRPQLTSTSWPGVFSVERESSSAGPEGMELAQLLNELRDHVTESAQVIAALNVVERLPEYHPMQPNRRFRMRVNVRMRGRGHAVPYRIDDIP